MPCENEGEERQDDKGIREASLTGVTVPMALCETPKRTKKECGLLSYPTGGLSRSGWKHMSGAGWGRALWRCPRRTCSIDKYRTLVALAGPLALCSNMKTPPIFSLYI